MTTLTPNPWRGRHPSVQHFEPLFRYDHLPVPLKQVSQIFHDAAVELLDMAEHDSPSLSDALRKLWEAKNSAVVHCGFVKDTAAPVQPAPGEPLTDDDLYRIAGRRLDAQETQVLKDAGVAPGTLVNRELLDLLMKGKGV
jgi:hypothetical protein